MARTDLREGISLPGVLLEVAGIGVLLTGESGTGKSEAALALVHRGHRLVADDTARFRRTPGGCIVGAAPPRLRGFLEVRGLGILDIRALWGAQVVKPFQGLHLVVHLQATDTAGFQNMDRLRGALCNYQVLEVPIPCRILPITAGRNTALLVETLAVQHQRRGAGHDAAEEFLRRRRQWLADDHTA